MEETGVAVSCFWSSVIRMNLSSLVQVHGLVVEVADCELDNPHSGICIAHWWCQDRRQAVNYFLCNYTPNVDTALSVKTPIGQEVFIRCRRLATRERTATHSWRTWNVSLRRQLETELYPSYSFHSVPDECVVKYGLILTLLPCLCHFTDQLYHYVTTCLLLKLYCLF